MGLNILAWVKAKKYTDNAVSQSAALHREIVTSLPITGDEHVIYMVPVTGSGDDNYNEYMWINGTYELIGNTRVDLTDYYNKTQVDAALSGKANAATSIAGYGITDAYTKTEVDTALSGKASTSAIPTALSQLTDDNTHRVVTDTEKSTWNGKANSATTLAGYGITNAYTKSDMNSFLKTANFIATLSSLANGAITDSISCTGTIPSGYKLIGCVGAYGQANNYALDIAQFYTTSTNVCVKVRNLTGGNRTNLEIVAIALLAKNA